MVLIDSLELENVDNVFLVNTRIENTKLRYGRSIGDRSSRVSLGREWLIQGTAEGISFNNALEKERILLALANRIGKSLDFEDGGDTIPILVTEVKTKRVAGFSFGVRYEIMTKEYDYMPKHEILSPTHSDALAEACVVGDLLCGNPSAKWARIPKGSLGQLLVSGLTLPTWTDGFSEIGSASLGANGPALTVSSLPYMPHLRVIAVLYGFAVADYPRFRFNDDSTASYCKVKTVAGTRSTALGENSLDSAGSSAVTSPYYIIMDIQNLTSLEKFCVIHSMYSAGGSSVLPTEIQVFGKWIATIATINSIALLGFSGNNLLANTYMNVYGAP